MSDREAFREARAAGKARHHEQRLENATYTAAEVKVLTEAALRLGRKEAGEEIAALIVAELEEFGDRPLDYATGMNRARRIAVDVSRFASGAASDATSGPGEGPGTSEPSKAAKTPQEDS